MLDSQKWDSDILHLTEEETGAQRGEEAHVHTPSANRVQPRSESKTT